MNMTSQTIEQLFQKHRYELAQAIFRIVRCEQTAADLVQDAYLRFISMGRSTSISFPRALLFRTAKNLAIDHLRQEKFEPRGEETAGLLLETASGAPSAEQVLSDKQRLQILAKAIETLPPRCQEAFLLHRVHECSYREIARRLSISESAVEKLIMRALLHCRTMLQRHDLA
ncbi:MAG: RNA polymerase sigma factor [Nitrospira sp.]